MRRAGAVRVQTGWAALDELGIRFERVTNEDERWRTKLSYRGKMECVGDSCRDKQTTAVLVRLGRHGRSTVGDSTQNLF